MGRSLKFRAWDGKKMYYASLEDLLFSMGSQGAGSWTLLEEVGEELAGFAGYRERASNVSMIYMEWTGLTDKNNRDIYEGDIAKHQTQVFEESMIGDIFWDSASFYFRQMIPKPTSGNKWVIYTPANETLEVIGNIYEHPHFLEHQ